jgi:hypothetical protein
LPPGLLDQAERLSLEPDEPEPTDARPTGMATTPLMADDEDEATTVGQAPSDVMAAAKPADPESEWRAVYADFVRTKQECKESIEGLTYERFSVTLKKNRDALVAKHGCKRVKFTVYVKDGKAALKAAPIKD